MSDLIKTDNTQVILNLEEQVIKLESLLYTVIDYLDSGYDIEVGSSIHHELRGYNKEQGE